MWRHFDRRFAFAIAGALSSAISQGLYAQDPAAQERSATASLIYDFDLPEQPLAVTLRDIGQRTGTNILFESNIAEGLRAPSLHGRFDVQQALEQVLRGTTLQARRTSARSIVVQAIHPSAAGTKRDAGSSGNTAAPPPQTNSVDRGDDKKDEAQKSAPASDIKELTSVIVTGTRIRGAEQASPVVTISQDDMRMQGQTDLGQAARALPQNFAGGQNPGVAIGAGGINNQNVSGSSSLNLRGLGQDATLTLLNGTRLPYDGFTQATDLAMVPVAAIDRMEVLLDGASAIYGSDAVGGVANVILKRDYNGAEVSARWGEATSGGFLQHQYT